MKNAAESLSLSLSGSSRLPKAEAVRVGATRILGPARPGKTAPLDASFGDGLEASGDELDDQEEKLIQAMAESWASTGTVSIIVLRC